jgi:hypothetical protein
MYSACTGVWRLRFMCTKTQNTGIIICLLVSIIQPAAARSAAAVDHKDLFRNSLEAEG